MKLKTKSKKRKRKSRPIKIMGDKYKVMPVKFPKENIAGQIDFKEKIIHLSKDHHLFSTLIHEAGHVFIHKTKNKNYKTETLALKLERFIIELFLELKKWNIIKISKNKIKIKNKIKVRNN